MLLDPYNLLTYGFEVQWCCRKTLNDVSDLRIAEWCFNENTQANNLLA